MHNNKGSKEDFMLANKDINKARFKKWICQSFMRKKKYTQCVLMKYTECK